MRGILYKDVSRVVGRGKSREGTPLPFTTATVQKASQVVPGVGEAWMELPGFPTCRWTAGIMGQAASFISFPSTVMAEALGESLAGGAGRVAGCKGMLLMHQTPTMSVVGNHPRPEPGPQKTGRISAGRDRAEGRGA